MANELILIVEDNPQSLKLVEDLSGLAIELLEPKAGVRAMPVFRVPGAAARWLPALDPLSHQAGVLAVFLGNGYVAVWAKSSRHLTDGNLPVLSGTAGDKPGCSQQPRPSEVS